MAARGHQHRLDIAPSFIMKKSKDAEENPTEKHSDVKVDLLVLEMNEP